MGAGASAALGCLFSPLIFLLILAGVLVLAVITIVFRPLVIICMIFGCGRGSGEAVVDAVKQAGAFPSTGSDQDSEGVTGVQPADAPRRRPPADSADTANSAHRAGADRTGELRGR